MMGTPNLMLVPQLDFLGLGGGSGLGIVVYTSYAQDLKTVGGSRDGQEIQPLPTRITWPEAGLSGVGDIQGMALTGGWILRAHWSES